MKRNAIIIFIIGLFLFTIGLPSEEIIGFESRFYLFALEMWRHGLTFFPTTYQKPYPDYPVTSTVLIYLFASIFGFLNKWVAVLPSAIAASMTLSLTYLIASLHKKRWGFYAVLFLIFTLPFLTEARTISLDMYVTAFTTSIFYTAYHAFLKNKQVPWVAVIFLLVLSFSIRGPMGLIIPTAVLFIFYLTERQYKNLMLLCFLSSTTLIICTLCLLGVAYHTGGVGFVKNVIEMQGLGRLAENNTPPRYFYFTESFGAFLLTYPLAVLFCLMSLPKIFQKNAPSHLRLLRALIGWVLIIMIGLSIPADKKIRYILPIAPALALICGYFFTMRREKYLIIIKKFFYIGCFIFPLLSLIALSLLYRKNVDLNYGLLSILLVLFQILAILSRKQDTHFMIGVITFFVSYVFIVEKINLNLNQTNAFVQQVESLRAKHHASLGFFKEDKDNFPIKYMVNMQKEERPLFISDLNLIPSHSIFMITSKNHFEELGEKQKSLQIMTRGKIGRDEVVIFVKK